MSYFIETNILIIIKLEFNYNENDKIFKFMGALQICQKKYI
jgi:hypothetical protein